LPQREQLGGRALIVRIAVARVPAVIAAAGQFALHLATSVEQIYAVGVALFRRRHAGVDAIALSGFATAGDCKRREPAWEPVVLLP